MPHEFLLDYLYPLAPHVKRMFGMHAVYVGEYFYLVTRKNEKNPLDNGIWIATNIEYHDSLKAQFPSLINMTVYKIKKWLVLPVEASDFEEVAIAICELIKSGDPRIGVLPKPKKKKK